MGSPRESNVSNEERLIKSEGSSSSSPIMRTFEPPLAPHGLTKGVSSSKEEAPPSYDTAVAKAPPASASNGSDFDELSSRAYQTVPSTTIGDTPAQIGCPHIDRRRRSPRLNVLEAIFFFPIGLIFHTVNPEYSCRHCGANLGRVGGRGVSLNASATRRQERRVERAQRRQERRVRCGTCNRRRCRPGCSAYSPVS